MKPVLRVLRHITLTSLLKFLRKKVPPSVGGENATIRFYVNNAAVDDLKLTVADVGAKLRPSTDENGRLIIAFTVMPH